MGRRRQVFIAPGEWDDPLPIPKSYPWHWGRRVELPAENWELVLDFAEQMDAAQGAVLRQYSYPEGDQVAISPDALDRMLSFFGELKARLIAAPPLLTEASDDYPDAYSNAEHANMLDVVGAVLREAKARSMPFEAYPDS